MIPGLPQADVVARLVRSRSSLSTRPLECRRRWKGGVQDSRSNYPGTWMPFSRQAFVRETQYLSKGGAQLTGTFAGGLCPRGSKDSPLSYCMVRVQPCRRVGPLAQVPSVLLHGPGFNHAVVWVGSCVSAILSYGVVWAQPCHSVRRLLCKCYLILSHGPGPAMR